MAEKNYNGRFLQKTDTSENWAKAVNFAPKLGEICFYSDLNKIKVGDGVTNINNLLFIGTEPESGGGGTWGSITGDLADQEDLQEALDGKADAEHTHSKSEIRDFPAIPAAVTESTVSGWGFTKNSGTYTKPSGGIPKTDLASAVQSSLDKADTAYTHSQAAHAPSNAQPNVQSDWNATSGDAFIKNKPTIPTIPSSLPASDVYAWAKAANKPSYTASEVGAVEKTVNANVSVLGAAKTTEKHGTNQAVFPNGAIFSGSAASAGLVTRGICGVSTPDASGSCGKDSLFINYDGDNTYRANRQLVLQAGAVGTHYGNNLYQFAAARGDAVKAYVDAAIAAAIAALPVYDGTVS